MDPKNALRYAWQPYVVAIALIAAAAALRLWPLQALGVRLAWLTFYPAVVAAALYGGFSAGLLGTFLSCLTLLYLLPAFVDQPFIRDSVDWLGLAVFFITCTMISSVAEAMRRAQARAKQAKEQLKTANRKLEAANKELEAFSYSVSHDLRAPLRSIDGFSQALLEDYSEKLDVEGKDHLQRVRAATRRMAQLIDDMLNLSRVTRSEMQREKVDLSTLAQTIAAELKKTQPERHVTFVIAPGLVAEGDARLLRAVLENLFSNAYKFTRKQPQAKIEFGLTRQDGQPVYFVRDNGAGLDMAYADKLFGVFQRLHGIAEFEGTGIGLATVQRIIHRHGGRIWAEGAVEKGATIYFTL